MSHISLPSNRSGFAGNENRSLVLRLSALSILCLGSGCISDSTLLQENASVALRSARFRARQDLNCPQVQVSVVSEQEMPGAPWGYLYSDYRIRAAGCSANAVYNVECRDRSLCDVTREAQ
jgi:hypothetical protein